MKIVYLALIGFTLFFTACSGPATHQDVIPEHETFKLFSDTLQEERTINVWLPQDDQLALDSLPVLYMADGGIQEDFPHVANELAELIKLKKIPPFILVGIENTERRRDLSGETQNPEDRKIAARVGGSAKFRNFIKMELFPEIAKRYQVSQERGILGESLSGLFVMETLFVEPKMFNYYIAFDPSLWWNDRHLLLSAKEKLANWPQDHPIKL